jgi:large subunit ribosomal protein L15
VNLTLIEATFENGAVITPEVLLAKKLISRFGGRIPKVKILATGKLTKKVEVSGCLMSEAAKAAIEAAGGKVTSL